MCVCGYQHCYLVTAVGCLDVFFQEWIKRYKNLGLPDLISPAEIPLNELISSFVRAT